MASERTRQLRALIVAHNAAERTELLRLCHKLVDEVETVENQAIDGIREIGRELRQVREACRRMPPVKARR